VAKFFSCVGPTNLSAKLIKVQFVPVENSFSVRSTLIKPNIWYTFKTRRPKEFSDFSLKGNTLGSKQPVSWFNLKNFKQGIDIILKSKRKEKCLGQTLVTDVEDKAKCGKVGAKKK